MSGLGEDLDMPAHELLAGETFTCLFASSLILINVEVADTFSSAKSGQ